MSGKQPDPEPGDGFLRSVRMRRQRQRRWRQEGEPSLGKYLAQVGVLGWIIVIPALIGLFLGRWLDHDFGTGIFWSAPLLMLGTALGFWSAWRWMHGR